MSAFETLKKAREVWPDIIDEKFVKRYVDEGLLSENEARQITEAGR